MESHLEACPGGSPLGKEGLLQSPTGVRCRKPIAVAYGLTGDSPSFSLKIERNVEEGSH